MAIKKVFHLGALSSQPAIVMNSDTGIYMVYDTDGTVLLERPLTDEELALTKLPEMPQEVASLNEAVDQLILDALMNELMMGM